MLHKRALKKPDGRSLWLYGRAPIPELPAPSPHRESLRANAHLRWHPLRGEWVAYAGHRQNRTFLPPAEYSPLAASADPDHPTEVPAGEYEVAVFENLFPTLTMAAHAPPETIVPARAGLGACEVVVFTQNPEASLASLPLWHIDLLFEVWADRYRELGAVDAIKYVYPFENRGVEVGVTLHHPHGQIYAYPFVPPVPAAELRQQLAYFEQHASGLLADHLQQEVADGRRVLYLSDAAIALVPVCARYSYEVWIAPRRNVPSLLELTAEERRELARALKTVLMKFDTMWGRPFPYIMAFHQAPTDGRPHPEAHFHIEIYPAYRMPGRLKYLAGSEIGAGVFTADTLPEEKARELQAVEVSID